jgi:hypothetical protein
MPGKFMKGALVEFMPTFLIPLPNVIIFQINPETITHTWTQAAAEASAPGADPLAVKGLPGEAFSFTISMDATDQIAEGNPLAIASGVYARLAALEMLLYPTGAASALLGALSGAASAVAGGSGGASRTVPTGHVPTTLFVWGPGRIVPVRVTGLTITEKLYDGLLNPTHADARLEMRVLTPDEMSALTPGPMTTLARGAYAYSQGLRQALAVANLANSVESIIGMLPV